MARYPSPSTISYSLGPGPVTPAAEEAEAEAPVKLPKTFKPRGKETLGNEELPLDDAEFEVGAG